MKEIEQAKAAERVKSVVSGAIVGSFALAIGIAISTTLNALFQVFIIPFLPKGGDLLATVYSGVATVTVFGLLLYVVV